MTTLERVARAMCAPEGIDPDCLFYVGVPWTMPGGYAPVGRPMPYWHSKLPVLVTALQALLQVDDETVEAMVYETPITDAMAKTAFTTAIDHILAEKP